MSGKGAYHIQWAGWWIGFGIFLGCSAIARAIA